MKKYTLNDGTRKRLKQIFFDEVISRIDTALRQLDDTNLGSATVIIDVKVDCDDRSNCIEQVQLMFNIQEELIELKPVHKFEWLNPCDHDLEDFMDKQVVVQLTDDNCTTGIVDAIDESDGSIHIADDRWVWAEQVRIMLLT